MIAFDALDLVCTDLDATLAFYRLLGVPIPEDKVWRTASGSHHIHDLDVGSSAPDLAFDSEALAAAYNEGYRVTPARGAFVIGFRVEFRQAVDDTHARLVAAGHPSRQAPYDAFWGARYAIVADPDGRDVGIMSPSDADHGGPPPDL